MRLVFLTAVGVGGATMLGSIIGFLVKSVPKRISDLTIAFSAGIMLSAAVWGLIIPSMGSGGLSETVISVLGIMSGAVFVGVCQRFIPKLRFAAGEGFEDGEADSVLMLVFAMAIHNFPEGLAAGVSLGAGDLSGAVSVAGGIALQNIPEGMAVVPPMLAVGISRKRAFLLALVTGFAEVFGTFLGYRAVTFFSELLPVSLAFAGGAMIYVIADEMIPRTKEQGSIGTSVFAAGMCVMLLLNLFL